MRNISYKSATKKAHHLFTNWFLDCDMIIGSIAFQGLPQQWVVAKQNPWRVINGEIDQTASKMSRWNVIISTMYILNENKN